LAGIGGEPLILRVAREVLRCGLTEVVVVTGYEPEACRAALAGLPVRFTHSASWASGIGPSIAAGVAALDPGLDGAFIIPGDMPFLSAPLLEALVREFARSDGQAIVFPTTPEGEQRNPVLWPHRFFADLASLSGRAGAKALLGRYGSACQPLAVADAQDLMDIDTPADLDAALARLAQC
jgi:molybdenum cofactor cytidylyltransferase